MKKNDLFLYLEVHVNKIMDSIKIKGRFELVCKDKDGNIKWSYSTPNTIMNAGKAQLALLAGDASAVPFTYLAVGTSSTAVAATQTALQAEVTDTGLARAAATVSRDNTGGVTNDTLVLTKTWTASGSKTIEEIGVFNDASAGTMLARALTTSKALVNLDQLAATYKVTFA